MFFYSISSILMQKFSVHEHSTHACAVDFSSPTHYCACSDMRYESCSWSAGYESPGLCEPHKRRIDGEQCTQQLQSVSSCRERTQVRERILSTSQLLNSCEIKGRSVLFVHYRSLRRHVATWDFRATREDELNLTRVSG